MTEGRFRFGEFEFDASSGELRRVDGTGSAERLPPQPARLLALLIEKNGEVLSREEIRRGLWPDTEVEFDASLHFCVRQVRAALGDAAAHSSYVETLPRRGYRLIPSVERIDEVAASRIDASKPRRRWQVVAALSLLGGLAAALLLTGEARNEPPPAPLRIAVMPFEPADTERFDVSDGIAEQVLEDLTLGAGEAAAIVGPTTTAAYDDSARSLRALASEYELDFIVNGRFIDDDSGRRMLAELIRVSDGAHIWVRAYTDLTDGRGIGGEIGTEVLDELDLSAGRASGAREP